VILPGPFKMSHQVEGLKVLRSLELTLWTFDFGLSTALMSTADGCLPGPVTIFNIRYMP